MHLELAMLCQCQHAGMCMKANICCVSVKLKTHCQPAGLYMNAHILCTYIMHSFNEQIDGHVLIIDYPQGYRAVTRSQTLGTVYAHEREGSGEIC